MGVEGGLLSEVGPVWVGLGRVEDYPSKGRGGVEVPRRCASLSHRKNRCRSSLVGDGRSDYRGQWHFRGGPVTDVTDSRSGVETGPWDRNYDVGCPVGRPLTPDKTRGATV